MAEGKLKKYFCSELGIFWVGALRLLRIIYLVIQLYEFPLSSLRAKRGKPV